LAASNSFAGAFMAVLLRLEPAFDPGGFGARRPPSRSGNLLHLFTTTVNLCNILPTGQTAVRTGAIVIISP
jgi:hypothetical protein